MDDDRTYLYVLDLRRQSESWRIQNRGISNDIDASKLVVILYPAGRTRVFVPGAVNAILTRRAQYKKSVII